MSDPVLSIGGWSFPSVRDIKTGAVNVSINHFLTPGQTLTFIISSTVSNPPDLWISITDMVWVVGPQQTRVNPVIPTGQDACQLLIADWSACKG